MADGRWIEVADRVFARRYEELDLTVGLVLGDEACLVIDTRGDEVQGAELAGAVREVTGLPWSVVLTHAHFDHHFGTAAFLPCPVRAHRRCRERMAAEADEDRSAWVRRYRDEGKPEIADALAAARLVLPDGLVEHESEVDLGGRPVRLVHPGRGHSDHDLVVHVPDVGVVFAGDLVEQGAPPQFGDAYPVAWPSALDTVLGLGATTVVPGHGDPVDGPFVARQRDEIRAVAELCRAVAAGELTEDEVLPRSPYPAEFTRAALARPLD